MRPSPQFPADLVTFTEKILYEKLHFLVSVCYKKRTASQTGVFFDIIHIFSEQIFLQTTSWGFFYATILIFFRHEYNNVTVCNLLSQLNLEQAFFAQLAIHQEKETLPFRHLMQLPRAFHWIIQLFMEQLLFQISLR